MIKRKLDSFGHIVVPREMQDTLNSTTGLSTDMSIIAEDGMLISTGEACQICGEGCCVNQPLHVCCSCRIKIRKSEVVKVTRVSYEYEYV